MFAMNVEETTLSGDKRYSEIFQEVESLQKEIMYYIQNYLPNVHLKAFMFGKQRLASFAILRQFRLMCLMFRNKLKPYNLDPRTKLLIFLEPKCHYCDSKDKLELHHIRKDGKLDRSTFDEYEVFIWSYYIIHLEEAVECLRVLCKDCHDNAHNSSSWMDMFDGIFNR